MDCSPPGFSVHGILQARILEWVAMPSSRRSSRPRDRSQVSHITSGFFTMRATREAQKTSVPALVKGWRETVRGTGKYLSILILRLLLIYRCSLHSHFQSKFICVVPFGFIHFFNPAQVWIYLQCVRLRRIQRFVS